MIDAPKIQADDLAYAGFWARFVALVIDGAILHMLGLFVGLVILAVVWSLSGGDSGHAPEGGQVLLLFFVVLSRFIGIISELLLTMHFRDLNVYTFIISWPYFAWMESSSRQATIGKRIMGIRVVTLDGKRLGFWRATGRHFGKFVSAALLMIGFIMAAFTAKRQALHDMMAETLVVRLISPKVVFEGDKA